MSGFGRSLSLLALAIGLFVATAAIRARVTKADDDQLEDRTFVGCVHTQRECEHKAHEARYKYHAAVPDRQQCGSSMDHLACFGWN